MGCEPCDCPCCKPVHLASFSATDSQEDGLLVQAMPSERAIEPCADPVVVAPEVPEVPNRREELPYLILQSLLHEDKANLHAILASATKISDFMTMVSVLPACFVGIKENVTMRALVDALTWVWINLSEANRKQAGDFRRDHTHPIWEVLHLYHIAVQPKTAAYDKQHFLEHCVRPSVRAQIVEDTCYREIVTLIADRFFRLPIENTDGLVPREYQDGWIELYRIVSWYNSGTAVLVMADVAARGFAVNNMALIQGLIDAEFGCVLQLVPLMRLPRKEVA